MSHTTELGPSHDPLGLNSFVRECQQKLRGAGPFEMGDLNFCASHFPTVTILTTISKSFLTRVSIVEELIQWTHNAKISTIFEGAESNYSQQ